MKYLGAISFLIVSWPLFANTVSVPAKAVVGVNASQVAQRVCYYQDQAYSEGAILKVGEHAMVCGPSKKHELNGALKWIHFNVPKNVTAPSIKADNTKTYSVN